MLNPSSSSTVIVVLVEFDDVEWKRREWFRVHDVFQVFLVEHTLVWTCRPPSEGQPPPTPFPALCYKPLVDKCGLAASKKRVVEFLGERDLSFVQDDDLHFHQEGDEYRYPSVSDKEELRKEIRTWVDYQDGQKILLTTPVVLVGSRVEVYRAEGTTQWYTAFIHSINDATKSLTITDDTVLESHNEDPALVQMRIIDNTVVHSILRGDTAPRRTSRQLTAKDHQPQTTFGRRQGQQQQQQQQPAHQTSGGVGSSSSSSNRQGTVTSKTRHGQALPPSISAPNPITCPQVVLTQAITATTTKPVSGQERVNSGRSSGSRSQVSERRKRKSDSSSSQSEEARSVSPSKRHKNTADTDSETGASETDRSSTWDPEKESSAEQTTDPSTSSSLHPPDHSATPLYVVSGSRDKTDSKSQRTKKGSSNSSKTVSSSSSCEVSHHNSSIVSVSKSSVDTATVNFTGKPAVDSLLTSTCHEKSEDSKENRDIVNTSSSSVKQTAASSGVDTGHCVRTSLPASTTEHTHTLSSAETLRNSDRKVQTRQVNKRGNQKVFSEEKGSKSSGSVRHGTGKADSSEQSVSAQDACTNPPQACAASGDLSRPPSGSSPCSQQQQQPPPSDCGHREEEVDTMHFKKQLLLAGGNNSPSASTAHSPATSISANIDVNRSVTDQLTKLAKAEKIALGGGDGKSDFEHNIDTATAGTFSNSLTLASQQKSDRDSTTVYDFMADRNKEFSSAFTSVRAGFFQGNSSSGSEERAESRASDSQLSSGLGDDRRPGSRLDDLRSAKSSPASSPLILDRSEPINIYRDPELMSKNPVRSGLSVTTIHKTMSGPGYPSAQGGVPAPPPGLTTSTTLASHPSALSRPLLPGLTPYSPHQLPPSALSHGLPLTHTFSQLDALTAREMAVVQQQQQQQQQIAALQQQYQNAAQLMHPMPYAGGHRLSQLELMWPQKMPPGPLTPAWLLAKHPEGTYSDGIPREHLERMEQDRIERERLEKRLEMERLERDRAERERREKREKMERERLEREKAEKEKADRERVERERLERQEKERKERERLIEQREWEQQRHQERERILRESAETSAQAAVDEHFVESFNRLAKLRGVPSPWVKPSITKGTGKGHIKTEADKILEGDRIKREADQQHAMMGDDKRYINAMLEQQRDTKPDGLGGKDGKPVFGGYPPYHYGGGAYPPHPSSTNVPTSSSKSEAIFSLYGYPSQQHSTITTEQLQKKGLAPGGRPLKEEKNLYSGPAGNPSPPRGGGGHAAGSMHLTKDIKMHNTVIVENKVKSEKLPTAAHSHHPSSLSSSTSSSPHPQPRPAHTPEQRPDRPLSSSTSLANPPLPPHLMAMAMGGSTNSFGAQSPHPTAFRSLDPKTMSRSQSPYKLVGGQPSMAVASHHPPSGGGQPEPINFSSRSKGQSPSPYPAPAIAQPPVSLPASSLPYNYSLIQQGLVPNPIYSQGSLTPAMQMVRSQQASIIAATSTSTHAPFPHSSPSSGAAGMPPTSQTAKLQPSPPGSAKRKSNSASRDNGSLQSKRAKQVPSTVPEVSRAGSTVSVPVTTPQVLTNPSPYTTSSSNSMTGRLPGGSLPTNNNGTFFDNFRSFVENTVQKEYSAEEEKSGRKEEKDSLQKQQELTQQQQKQQQQQQTQQHQQQQQVQHSQQQQQMGSVDKADVSVTGSSSREEVTPSPAQSVSCQSSSHTVSSSSMASIVDTINRVVNAQDTDSDTLSASSPPPQACTGNASPQQKDSASAASSPASAGTSKTKTRFMKKKWLEEYTGGITLAPICKKPSSSPLVPSPLALAQDDSNSSHSTSTEVKQFFKTSTVVDHTVPKVNGDVSPSPALTNSTTSSGNGLNLPNGNISSDLQGTNYESTSSASETEMQTTTSPKKRSKSKKSNSAKKVKTEEKAPSPIPTSQPSSTPTTSTRSKKTSNKRTKNEKESSKVKERPSPPETRSVSPSPTSTPRRSPAPASSSVSTSGNSSSKKDEKPSKMSSSKQAGDISLPPSPPLSQNQDGEKSSSPETVANSNRDKKKTRRNKEAAAKDTPSRNGKQGSSFNEPLLKCSVATLKRTGAQFLQNGPCSEVTPKLSKCRECKMTPNQRSKKIPNIFCRFYAFRRLKYSSKGAVAIAGFSELSDAVPDDIEPWLPRYPVEEPVLDEDIGKFILSKVGDKFCELVEQEKEAKSLSGMDPPIVWKRAVTGVREMCDVCDTTLFNMHWVCHKCGFVVCLDCYKAKVKATEGEDEEDCKWLTCSSNRQAHDARRLMLTQIIPSDALWELGRLIHDIRRKWSIPAKCHCSQNALDSKPAGKNGMNPPLMKKMVNGTGGEEPSSKKSRKAAAAAAAALQAEEERLEGEEYNQDRLALLANVALGGGDKASKRSKLEKLAEEEFGEDGDKKSGCSTLRELLTKTAGKGKVPNEKKSKPKSSGNTLDDIIQSVVERSCRDLDQPNQTFKFLHYIPRLGQWNRELPIITHNLTETSVLYPDVPHSWLCDGRLLRLHDPRHKGNLKIFQEQWKRGQPVLVSCVHKLVNKDLWKPDTFNKEFGHQDNDLINCRSSNVIVGHPMSDFWEGFESIKNRQCDEDDDPMLLKLKDWPPGDDFSELLPSHFHDLMQALPLPEYTRRSGKLNLASRLPDFLVRPDLGPKMYNAYGSAKFPKEGTTNLHLDISDAVNVLVHVGVANDRPAGQKEHEEAAVRAIDEAGCDSITKRRVREVHELPGALWQIYDAHDADKIRDFLNKVAKERGEIIEPDHDSIHDQSWYLDEELRDRLLKEYGVQGYTIVQCLGDAIFIPAGAPHQVRNMHSCIKVAEDFVSPEHINHCFRLTQEFRQLSNTHSNHEDKLQVKNIIYHAVKDSIAVLRELDPDDKK
ncbi:hypothetical protein ACOMHN_022623 [Nucella lapillus]